MHAARALVAGNWKMHKTIAETTAFVRELLALDPDLDAVDAVDLSAVYRPAGGGRSANRQPRRVWAARRWTTARAVRSPVRSAR